MLDIMHSVGLLIWRSCSHICALQVYSFRLCRLDPPHSLHALLRQLCSHICDPPHSLHRLWRRAFVAAGACVGRAQVVIRHMFAVTLRRNPCSLPCIVELGPQKRPHSASLLARRKPTGRKRRANRRVPAVYASVPRSREDEVCATCNKGRALNAAGGKQQSHQS